jgi:hypothetical protein
MLVKKLLLGLSITLALALMIGVSPSPGYAELESLGQYNEYFHDTVSGLYWFDPGVFYSHHRSGMDSMATHSTIWNWATSAQIDDLVGQTAATGFDLEDIIGPRITTIANGGPRWLGYYAETDPDGWLAESNSTPDFATMTGSGYQGGAASMGAGAWLVSSTNPTVTGAVLENYGPNGEYFHDLGTDFFWSDPATFYGMTRAEVETWLAEHSSWRWASANEVYELLGKTSTDGTALDQIIGARLTTVANGGPRWVGYYDQAAEPTGILMQADVSPHFYLLDSAGTQSGAEALGAGAWILNEDDPTPTNTKTLGGLKALYR